MQIRADNISYSYDKSVASSALKNISFEVRRGGFLAVLGVSGSGKSTLCRLLTGLIEPDEGRILIGGELKPPKKLFRKVAMVFQYPERQFVEGTVFDEIAFAPRNLGYNAQRVEALVKSSMGEVGLDYAAFYKRNPFRLSGGEKRRVAIASVLAMDSEVLIFDEPTAGLDENGKVFVRELARSKNLAGITVIWVTHRLEEAAEMADGILLMGKDMPCTCGDPVGIFSDRPLMESYGLTQPIGTCLISDMRDLGAVINLKSMTQAGVLDAIAEWKEARSG